MQSLAAGKRTGTVLEIRTSPCSRAITTTAAASGMKVVSGNGGARKEKSDGITDFVNGVPTHSGKTSQSGAPTARALQAFYVVHPPDSSSLKAFGMTSRERRTT